MPEIKHHFRAGKMNKDLDERLVPNGEYRDALNVQIATSEGDDVGALQNVLGNQVRSSISLSNAKCIGVIDDQENDKIYWFVTNNSTHVIAEYETNTKTVTPILVDTNDVLQFNKDLLITGINIIDGLLFFTDDNSEPKVINIQKFKDGSTNFTTHTQLTDQSGTAYNFQEADVVVIKPAPETAPSLTMHNTSRINSDGTAMIVQTSFSFNPFAGTEYREPGDLYTIYVQGLGWQVGDTIISSGGSDGDVFEDEYAASWKVFSVTSYNAVLKLSSIAPDLPSESSIWSFKLLQPDALFEKDFVRFAYRYKYKDGEYTPFSPFSQVAFLTDKFEYDPARGFNTGMVNQLRKLTVSGFRPTDIPNQVDEVELLFKKDISTNIYSVETFTVEDAEWASNSFDVTSEIIHKILPSMQLLRPWDNVPLKAKSQELVANRIVYGNYLQNFDMVDSGNTIIKPEFEMQTDPIGFLDPADFSDAEFVPAGKSIKSQRNYQIGVVYRDKFGRETPVQTSDSGGLFIPKSDAENYNRLKVKINSNAPSFATSFKYFIKDANNQYYNLAQDRWYDAEDGNVWLSFPSSERNKVDEETFLILKKTHDGDELVVDSAKYKIIDISNEAPTELKEVKASFGVCDEGMPHPHSSVQENIPKPEAMFFDVHSGRDGVGFEDQFGENSEILSTSNLCVRIVASGRRSKWYDIANLAMREPVSNGKLTTLRINLAERLEQDVAQFFPDGTASSAVSGISYEIAQTRTKNKAEFTGRFFVKVYKDASLMEYILNSNVVENYSIVNTATTSITRSGFDCGGTTSKNRSTSDWNSNATDSPRKLGWCFSNCKIWSFKNDLSGPGAGLSWASSLNSKSSWNSSSNTLRTQPIKIGRDTICIGFNTERSITGIRGSRGGIHRDFLDGLLTGGTKIRFSNDPNGNVYTIKKVAHRSVRNFNKSDSSGDDGWARNKRRLFILKLDKAVQDWDLFTDGFPNASGFRSEVIEVLEEYESQAFRTKNPAIWETEPKEQVELDIYYEASSAFPMTVHGLEQSLDYFNCYSFGNGVESNRIRDDFNAPTISKGVKASAPLAEQYKQERRKSGLIYSQIYNSTSGLNGTNQFIQADKITKDLNPEYGSIQKLHVRGTDILALCEDKVVKILANKDALFNADGNANLTASNAVLGQAIIPPTFGEFGISKNPESFAYDGYRAYFTDKARGAVLRLSMDGITPISGYGMSDYFGDTLANMEKAIGSFDANQGVYSLCLYGKTGFEDKTVNFKEEVQGWTSFASYIPEQGISINDEFYTFKNGEIWQHDNEIRNNYYGIQYNSKVKVVFNEMPDMIKTFKTLNYEGTQAYWQQNLTDSEYYNNQTVNGWYASSVETDMQSGYVKEFKEKEGKWFNYIHGTATTLSNLDTSEFTVQGIGQLNAISGDTAPTQITITVVENND